MTKNKKCKLCKNCNGYGCIGELPGMGGVFKSANFIANCAAWEKYYDKKETDIEIRSASSLKTVLPKIRLAPMTGAVENAGYYEEKQFYFDLIKNAIDAGLALSLGDGFPDEKLLFGIEALHSFKKKAAVFFKPYPQKKLFDRIEMSRDVAEIIGVDTDAYNIVTMRNLVHLEKKNACDLRELRKRAKLPFAVKGVFTFTDMEIIKELKPEIVIISNHGGRIETEAGSTADFAARHLKEIAKYTHEVWIDGGLRKCGDFIAASSLGASEILLGRPCITAILRDKDAGIKNMIKEIFGGHTFFNGVIRTE
ncbi:alpha-hydroxy-acid oxidizing protein [Treponema pedis]|uniref:alpha-hydroxy-acid oxidizing protein n=1 Tax=Treponema pedis TaxID=409322 RepID=UPI0003FCBCBF|nr:alpha-hydroxy-acid oxidizing protein [Treponema pedis]